MTESIEKQYQAKLVNRLAELTKEAGQIGKILVAMGHSAPTTLVMVRRKDLAIKRGEGGGRYRYTMTPKGDRKTQ